MRQPVALLRWHISRLGYLIDRFPGEPEEVQVSVARSSNSCLRFWKSHFNDPGIAVRDVFSWWDEPADGIQSWIRSELILEALAKRNLLVRQDNRAVMNVQRILTEDMVFLQFMFYQKQFDRVWSDAQKRGEGLEKVIRIPSSRWLDFTRPAREASATMYGILLKTRSAGGEK